MAFQTGSIIGTDALIPVLSTFMQANGWTLIDTLAADDLVFRSSGSSGKFPMIIRVSDHDAAVNNDRKAPYDPIVKVPQVYFRGYHGWTTGSLSIPTISASFSSSGGTLVSGLNYYRVTALGSTGETLPSLELSISGALSGANDITWAYVSGAVGYKVYGRASGSELLLSTLWGKNQLTWRDLGPGSFTGSAALPLTGTAHGGYNEYGLNGYTYVEANGNGTAINNMTEYRLDGPNGPVLNTGLGVPSVLPQCYTNSFNPWFHQKYNGSRLCFCPDNTNTKFVVWDIVTGDIFRGSANPDAASIITHASEWVYNAVTDKWTIYALTNGSPATAFFSILQIYDFETDTWQRGAVIPWTTVAASGGGFLLWDGADTLYIIPAASATAFYKYSVSNNTFTQLTNLPVGRVAGALTWQQGSTQAAQMYVPASVSGFSSDVIYMLLDSSTTLYCYNVNSNAFNVAGTPNITIPFTFASNVFLTKDARGYSYVRVGSNTFLYRMHHGNSQVTFGAPVSVFESNTSFGVCPMIWDHPVGSVRVNPVLSTTYYFFGGIDGITVATNQGNLGRYYWSYFGRSSSRRRTNIMTQTIASSTGSSVTVTVDTTAAYAAGDNIYFFDPSNMNQEQQKIASVQDGTHLVMQSMTNPYSAGALIGVDPFQTMITGDSGQASTPADPGGYKHDLQGSTYFVYPTGWAPLNSNTTVTNTAGLMKTNQYFNMTAPDGMGYYQPIEPWIVCGNEMYATTPVTYPARGGYYGTIPNVFFLPSVSTGPQAGAVVTIGTKNYIYLPQTQLAKMTYWNYGVLLGTTN